MNFDFDAVMFLALFTLGAGLVIGLVSWMRARKAQDHHEDAAVAERQRHEDPRVDVGGTPGDIDPTVSHHGDARPAPRPAAPSESARDGNITGSTDSGRTWSEERGANPPTPNPPRN